jgi:hypothetical protein
VKYTIKTFKAQFPDDSACLAFIFALRCPKGTKCAKCGKSDAFHPVGRWRAYECACGAFFSPCAGTIFHKSPTPLTLWFHALFLFATAKNGVSAMELTRQLGVTYKCAWRMARQIRLLMAQDDGRKRNPRLVCPRCAESEAAATLTRRGRRLGAHARDLGRGECSIHFLNVCHNFTMRRERAA